MRGRLPPRLLGLALVLSLALGQGVAIAKTSRDKTTQPGKAAKATEAALSAKSGKASKRAPVPSQKAPKAAQPAKATSSGTSKGAPQAKKISASKKSASLPAGAQTPSWKPIPPSIQALGPMSVGLPNTGFLVNGVKIPEREDWMISVPSHGYGTPTTIEGLTRCIPQVRRAFPGSPRVMLGSLSGERGGYLPPHKSHRTGRDVDVYFFRKPGARVIRAATEEDIDLPRTWALLRCFVTQTDVDMVLIDRRVQGWLENYAASIGEDKAWLTGMFHDSNKGKTAVVRHVPGHVAHMHVRFASPKERRVAVAHYDELVSAGIIVPEKRAVVHVVERGDTLLALARRYQTDVKTIQELNDLGTSVIRIGQRLTIQQAVDLKGAREPVAVRARYVAPGEPVQPAVVASSEPAASPVDAPAAPRPSPASLPVASPSRAPVLVPSAPPSAPAGALPTPASDVAPDVVVPPGPPPRVEVTSGSQRRAPRLPS